MIQAISTFSSLFMVETQLRYFRLARYALKEAFRLLKLKPGDRVLLPEFVCRDLLASLHELAIEPVWYSVGPALEPDADSQIWPIASAVVAINYFGFPQNLVPFNDYAKRTGAVVIEDNAHGFLSRDQAGYLLGTRTSLGIFSFRKTLLIGRGAGLAVNSTEMKSSLINQIPANVTQMPIQIIIRRISRKVFCSSMPDYHLARFLRKLRALRGYSEIPLPQQDAEIRIPMTAPPDSFLMKILSRQNLNAEVHRRRDLYIRLSQRACELGLEPIFPSLPENVVPYGLPLFGTDIAAIAQLAAREYLDYFKWPDLPTMLGSAPRHYSNIYLINFL